MPSANLNGNKLQIDLEWLSRPLVVWLTRFSHRRSQGEYTVVLGARLSASSRSPVEGDSMVVYIDHLGRGHVRLHEEFHEVQPDGGKRFEEIPQ